MFFSVTTLLATLALLVSVQAFVAPTSSTRRVRLRLAMMADEEAPEGRRAFFAAAAATLAMGVPSFALADTLHKMDYPVAGKCGQAEIPDNVVFIVKQLGGFQDGSCAVEGYTVEEGTAKGTGEKDKERDYSIYGK